MQISYPVLKGDTRPHWPSDGRCPVCGKNFREAGQVAYIMAGASWDAGELSVADDVIQAFLNVGVHGARTDVKDSADIEIVSDLHGGQFDFEFCSTGCLRSWLNSVVDRVEQDLRQNLSRAADAD
jgi:hypothetical protein